MFAPPPCGAADMSVCPSVVNLLVPAGVIKLASLIWIDSFEILLYIHYIREKFVRLNKL